MSPEDIANADFAAYAIYVVIAVIVIMIIVFLIRLRALNSIECKYMTNMYGTIDGNITSVDPSSPDASGNLYDYYIKTAYNACSGGSYKNDYVNICNLKNVLKQGVRGLDFEVFSVNDNPVVSTSTSTHVDTYIYTSMILTLKRS